MAEKVVFEYEAMEAVAEVQEERDRPVVGEFMKEQYARLVEHWAYEEGWQDALKRVEEESVTRCFRQKILKQPLVSTQSRHITKHRYPKFNMK